MKILGLYWGISSTASLFIDDQIVGAVSEERFSRVKNDDNFPSKAIEYLLEENGLKPSDLDGVAIASYIQGLPFTILHKGKWAIEDHLKEQHEIWHASIYGKKERTHLEVFADKIDRQMYPQWYWAEDLKTQVDSFPKDREMIVAKHLGIPVEKVRRIEHHRCHAAYAYYSSPFREKKILSFTIDGMGDGKNATINIVDEKGNIERVFQTNDCNIGRIYRYMTLLLGMKPNEHEFKVMGLAPYGKPRTAEKALEVFRSTLYVDGIEFKWKNKPTDSYFWFKERLEGCRFDGIAAAMQQWVEELLVEWISNAIDQFKISSIVLSGGVSMNIKANGKIAALPQVKEMFIGGTGSDESMALSSAICLAQDFAMEKSIPWEANKIKDLPHLYLGPKASKESEKEAICTLPQDRFQIIENPTPEQIADVMISGKVLARCAGRMEFGQRSLGNRSIMADPIHKDIVPKINHMIKNRDFWMPFAPMVMNKYVAKYLVNPKNFDSPHMTIGFETTAEGRKAMPAGLHPADYSARPQILKREANPELYNILEAFESKTGRGAVLNTSFNLHGFPIVNTAKEAVEILIKTELDALLLNHYLIFRV